MKAIEELLLRLSRLEPGKNDQPTIRILLSRAEIRLIVAALSTPSPTIAQPSPSHDCADKRHKGDCPHESAGVAPSNEVTSEMVEAALHAFYYRSAETRGLKLPDFADDEVVDIQAAIVAALNARK